MSTQSPLPTVERWTHLVSNGGARLSTAGFLAPTTLVTVRSTDGPESIKISQPLDAEAAGLVAEGQTIRLRRSDSDFEEWPVGPVSTRHAKEKSVDEITGSPLLYLLGSCGNVPDIIASTNGKPRLDVGVFGITLEELIQNYLIDNPPVAALLPFISIGTIEPTVAIDLSWSSASPLAVIRAGMDAVMATGELCELELERDGTAGYKINIWHAIGQDADVVDLRMSRNATSMTRSYDPTSRATRIEPLAAPLGGEGTYLGQARWPISAKSTNVLTLIDPRGGKPPIAFDNECIGLYLYNESNGAFSAITDSSYDPATNICTVTVASGTNFAVGDYTEFRVDTDGTQPYFLDHPVYSATSEPGIGVKFGTIDRSDLQGVSNLVPNSILRTWSDAGALPDGYTAIDIAPGTSFGGTFSQNTDPLYTKLGGKSLLFSAASGTLITPPVKFVPWYDHQRMSIRLRVLLTTWNAPGHYMQLSLGIMLADGTVHKWDENDKTLLVQPANRRPAPWTGLAGGVWVDMEIDGIDVTVPSTVAYFGRQVVQADIDALATDALGFVVMLEFHADHNGPPSGENIEGYFDGVILTPSDVAADDVTEFGGANSLWQATNLALDLLARPQVSYAIDVVDLKRKDPTLDEGDLVLGGRVRIWDPDLDLLGEPQRIVEIQKNELVEGDTRIVLASKTKRLTQLLLKSGRTGKTSGLTGPGTTSGSGTTTGTGTTGGPTGGTTGGGTTVGGTSGTYAPVLTITLDISNVPTAVATVPSSVARVKFAWNLAGIPSDASVRAAASVTPSPFTSTFTAITEGETLYVAAFAYDTTGAESLKGFASVTASAPATDTTDLLIWYRADSMVFEDSLKTDPATITGDDVATWGDLSGNSHDAPWAGAGQPPELETGAANGHDVVDFDATHDEHYDLDADLSALTEGEMFIVVKANADPPPGTGSGGSHDGSLAWLGGSGDGGTLFPATDGHVRDDFGSTVRHDVGDLATDLSADYVVYNVKAAHNDWSAYLNGALVFHTGTNTVSFPSDPHLGARQNGGFGWDGQIAEFRFYTPVRTDDERASITSELGLRYLGVAVGGSFEPTLSVTRSGGDVVVTATAPFADSVKIAASLLGTPTDSTVRATTAITTLPYSATFTAPAEGETLHVAAFGYQASSESAKVTLSIPFSAGDEGPSAPSGAEYVVAVGDPSIPNARALINTASATWDFSVPNEAKVNLVGSGIALDDVSDVDTSGVSDGDLLAFDSGSGHWVPVPPAAASNLDDLGDVNAPSPADGDVLTYDTGTSKWISAVSTGGTGNGRWDPMALRAGQSASALDDDWSNTGTTLNARWTGNANWPPTSFDIDTTHPKHLFMRATGNSSAVRAILQAIPAGDFVIQTVISASQPDSTLRHADLILTDGTGASANIIAILNYQAGANAFAVQSGTVANFTANLRGPSTGQNPLICRWRRISGAYTMGISADGVVWFNGAHTPGFTPTHFGIGGAPFGADLEASFATFRYSATATTLWGAYL